MNFRYIIFLLFVFLILFLVIHIQAKEENTSFSEAKENIIIRKIGHEILLLSGDSSSRVLPIKKHGKNEYHISFETHLTFTPDSLIKAIHQVVSTNNLPADYIVNVVECISEKVVFGYAISNTEQNNIVPCVERQLPENCYYIAIKFDDKLFNSRGNYLAGIGVATFSILLFGYFYNKKKDPLADGNADITNDDRTEETRIGKYKLSANELSIGEEIIPLSVKEFDLITIFANNPDVIIERSRLQKELWEDNGVVVGRSLDVFISRLRKKLEQDPSVRIVNIHGKGYKLEIKASA